MSELKITCGIVFHHEASQVFFKLDELNQHRDLFDQILVVLCQPTDEVRLRLEQWMQLNPFSKLNIRVFEILDNNIARARQTLLDNASFDWVYFTDPDCRLSQKSKNIWLELKKINLDVQVAYGSGVILGGSDSRLNSNWFLLMLKILSHNRVANLGSLQSGKCQKNKLVQMLSTSQLLVNKNQAQKAGGFDQKFYLVGEDMAFCHRLKKNHVKLMALKDADVEHDTAQHLLIWLQKMFKYGKAQILVAKCYPEHFLKSFRGVQFLAIFFAPLMLIFSPKVFTFSFLVWYLLVFLYSLASLEALHELKKVKWIYLFLFPGFVLLTYFAYAMGELWGCFNLLRLNSLPQSDAA